jgi:hypothetical protein
MMKCEAENLCHGLDFARTDTIYIPINATVGILFCNNQMKIPRGGGLFIETKGDKNKP